MNTLLLHPTAWDLLVDASGNIALASNPYAISQDVASACKLALGELWYNTDKGIPYFQSILGYRPSISQLKKEFEQATLSVPEVSTASVNINQYQDRNLSGNVSFTANSITGTVNL